MRHLFRHKLRILVSWVRTPVGYTQTSGKNQDKRVLWSSSLWRLWTHCSKALNSADAAKFEISERNVAPCWIWLTSALVSATVASLCNRHPYNRNADICGPVV